LIYLVTSGYTYLIASALENGVPLILTEDVTYPVIEWKGEKVEIANPFI